MKKLYRKGTVHPSPPPLVSSSENHLSLAFLPPTILTLAVALSPQDREVLAYLISCASSSTSFSASQTRSSSSKRVLAGSQGSRRSNTTDQHPPSFNCYCFGCYMSYWIRWDSSPNRQLIDEIIDTFEQDGPSSSSLAQKGKSKSKKEKRRKNNKGLPEKSNGNQTGQQDVMKRSCSELLPLSEVAGGSRSTQEMVDEVNEVESREDSSDDDGRDGREETSVRRFMGFLGEKIWSIWN